VRESGSSPPGPTADDAEVLPAPVSVPLLPTAATTVVDAALS